ncbi:MAG: CDC48 family AAA ATPase [Candidatus Hodarchaeales archaeon]|jgi:transitional endoplasmic reticulum ATPase
MKEIMLKIAESRQRDVGHGRIRMSNNNMRAIDVSPGDIVEITSKNSKTGVTVFLAYKEDQNSEIIRIDGITRRNLGIKLGDIVKVGKADVKIAETVKISPMDDVTLDSTLKQFIKQKLRGYPVTNGDLVLIQLLGQALRFITESTSPGPDEICLITDTTNLRIEEKSTKMKDADSQINYEDIGGLDDAIKKIREMVELPLRHPELFRKLGINPPKGVLLHGPPGTGKTLIAKAVANEGEAHFVHIQGPEIMSKFYGESEAKLREIFKEAEENSPGIIFIDEIDAVAPKREDVTGEVERRVVAQILALMDGLEGRGQVIVIGASNRPNALDPALRRPGRFDREINIKVPSQQERLEILQIHTRRMPGIEKVNLEELARITHGFVGADLAALGREAAMCTLREVLPYINYEEGIISAEILEKLKVNEAHFYEALKEIQPSAIREIFIETPNIKWEDVGGLEDIKQNLIEAVEWPLKRKENLIRMGINPPKGILLYGPPGTGKTMLARAIASESEANFIAIKGPELLSKWVGESEKNIREIFQKARMASPVILFFDEIDAITEGRGQGSSEGSNVSQRMLSQLLTEMDGLEPIQDIVIIGATNRPDLIDSALLRPGRFDRLILVPPPNKDSLIQILKAHTKTMPLNKDVDLENYALGLLNYTGADIQALCHEAGLQALRENIEANQVHLKHFEQAKNIIHPSINDQIISFYENIEKIFRHRSSSNIIQKDKLEFY